MTRSRWTVAMALCLSVPVLLCLTVAVPLWTTAGQADSAGQVFAVSRVAIVDISTVYDNYSQTQKLEGEGEALKKRLKELQEQHADLAQEFPALVTRKAREENLVAKVRLEFAIQEIKEEILPRFMQKQLRLMDAFRADFQREVNAFRKKNDLDLVLEKQIVADASSGKGVRWPIVHSGKSQFDITETITLRLNDLYRLQQ